MYGIIFALLYAAYLVAGGTSGLLTYPVATNFLYSWYLYLAIAFGAIRILFALFPPLIGLVGGLFGGGRVGGVLGGLFGGALGGIAGGALSLWSLFAFVLKWVLYVGGAYLLHAALTLNNGVGTWNKEKLILGGVLLLIGLWSDRSRR